MFDLYKETGDERYRKAIDYIYEKVPEWGRNSKGGFWHMSVTPNQMWLDSLYMIGPFLAMYSKIQK
ncbi:MAG: glycoside hydrolase family 88 protein [Clostridiales bacterium]|nr:MAG: glycoside hydrolase family 88 protein [Clostridiales bacterium]